MNEETSLIAFKAICNFVNDLESEYGKRHKPLKLYKRLINHTQITHEQAIKKHINVFHNFCNNNRDGISSQDLEKVNGRLDYSEKVYIDIKFILNIADNETRPLIWKHLLTISAIVDPAGRAKEILKKSTDEGKTGKEESDFLNNIISKVEKNINPNANPAEAVSSIMQSGLINDLMSDLGSKKLDLNKLLGAVQGMVSSLGNQVGDDPEAQKAMGMLNSMTSMMGNSVSGNENMSGMMQMMSSMMSSMNVPKVEEVTDQKD